MEDNTYLILLVVSFIAGILLSLCSNKNKSE